MKPKHGLPCGVRLITGLGGAGGTTALALAAEAVAEPERRTTLSIGVVFTTSSVPELSPVQRRLASKTGVAFLAVSVVEPNQNRCSLCAPHRAWCLAAGQRPAEGRAATTRLTPSLFAVPKNTLATGLRFYAAQTFRLGVRSRAANKWCRSALLAPAGTDAQTKAFHLTEFIVIATPNVQDNRRRAAGRAWARMK